ncbi:MAG: hypothetical protein RLZZ216_2151 [Cyanobacteriota bacterium]
MVNASLNWASIVGIVLAVGGALLYFMRSFKPALARDYDVFFAAIGLLCGGILFFQGWRLDPILQFGQFLLAATTVFFAYESVRLRGVSTEQARRSAYFDDEPAPSRGPAGGLRGDFDPGYDRFDEPQPLRRRFRGSEPDGMDDDGAERDFYRPRRPSRAAIPEQAASRRRGRDEADGGWSEDSERERRMARFGRRDDDDAPSRSSFGERRSQRQDQRRGSRPSAASPRDGSPAAGRMRAAPEEASFSKADNASPVRRPGSLGESRNPVATGSTRFDSAPSTSPRTGTARPNPTSTSPAANPPSAERPTPRSSRPRDNSSRFDD